MLQHFKKDFIYSVKNLIRNIAIDYLKNTKRFIYGKALAS